MTMRFFAMAAIAAAICASGCSKANQPGTSSQAIPSNSSNAAAGAGQQATGSDADAIRAAIEEHVRGDHSVNMDAMDMSVSSVSVNGDQAHAEAAFRLKTGGTGMAMTYFLQRQGSGWVVTKSQPSDGQFAHPPVDGTHSTMPNPGEPAMPDLTDFLKNHPPDSKN